MKNIEKNQKKNFKEKFIEAESYILKIIGYDLDIEVSSTFIEKFKKFENYPQNKEIQKKFLEHAYSFNNEIYRTTLPIAYNPVILALTAINFAKKEMDLEFIDINIDEKMVPWYNFFSSN